MHAHYSKILNFGAGHRKLAVSSAMKTKAEVCLNL